MPPGERPWRKWCEHQSFGQITRAGLAKIKDQKIRHVDTVKQGGRSEEISCAPAPCCITPGCNYHTKALAWEPSMWALWSHLENCSASEAATAQVAGDRSGLTHPIPQLMRQLER